ncbi:MAG: gliding motility lipoprotein GldH [Paludibacteraceae bacterium]|nr:gliding motility lipoprotein GldH [Paludibacteraceae bacterium]
MRRQASYIITIALLSILCSCTRGVMYSHYENVPCDGWHADSVLKYDICPTDSVSPYIIAIDIRHNEQYPFQNIWLFADLYADSVFVQRDTLEYYLADHRGEWLGSGFGRLKNMSCLWLSNTTLPPADTMHIYISHGMRCDTLTGVEAVGVTIEEQNK